MLLQHGLLDSQQTWLHNDRNQSLAYILADQGYDVWLLNSRGNKYSIGHTLLNTQSSKFWSFSFHEMAVYDLPACIDHVVQKTGYKRVNYIGHSQGTQIGFIAFSMFPRVEQQVKRFIALAPVAGVSDIQVPFARILAQTRVFTTLPAPGIHSFLILEKRLELFLGSMCKLARSECMMLFCNIVGCSENSTFIPSRLPMYLRRTLSGTSLRNMRHWIDLLLSRKFRDRQGNAYPIEQLAVDTAIFYGTSDRLAIPTDVQHLVERLPSQHVIGVHKFEGFGHMDFTWDTSGIRALPKPTVYSRVLDHLRQS